MRRNDYLQQKDEIEEIRLRNASLDYEEMREDKNISIANLRERIKKLRREK